MATSQLDGREVTFCSRSFRLRRPAPAPGSAQSACARIPLGQCDKGGEDRPARRFDETTRAIAHGLLHQTVNQGQAFAWLMTGREWVSLRRMKEAPEARLEGTTTPPPGYGIYRPGRCPCFPFGKAAHGSGQENEPMGVGVAVWRPAFFNFLLRTG